MHELPVETKKPGHYYTEVTIVSRGLAARGGSTVHIFWSVLQSYYAH